jgi:hypothetical protein
LNPRPQVLSLLVDLAICVTIYESTHNFAAPYDILREMQGGGNVLQVGLYPIVTFQYSSTTL